MSLGSTIVTAIKGKIVVTALVSLAVVGGGTAALAASPAGQNFAKSIAIPAHTATPDKQDGKDQNAKNGATQGKQSNDHKNGCPGLAEAQNLAKKFSLSTDSKGATIQLICSLHDGTYKGLDHPLGFGEIEDLLTYAQYLAGHDKSATNAKLTDETLSNYVANALKTCNNGSITACVKANMSATQGKDGNNNGSSNGTDHSKSGTTGKPTITPTPHH
ncbi:hypothetical protein KSD_24290 [Ktedonobacter sp. SOSP1-85]|uniref:hypothetical protein n=1 Tax=Ktedonobacter sp. SOSP1-85 TaxID=2778367 RepID=UPI001914DE74|nr:hypothetical protein [Ktedonobacter sp. SOSP1-85]GHO74658.1 hypothetical protein KSD_24290 [Ktedonobacter sp. SOSP1-85]